jgi:hypothetical protein
MNVLRTIIKLAMPTCFAIGLILGTFLLCNLYQSWTPTHWVAAGIVVPPILYLVVDRQGVNRTLRSFGCFVLRLCLRHVRLATYLWTAAVLAWLLVGMTAVSTLGRNKPAGAVERGGLETEQFFGFANGVTAPIQLLWSGLVLLWQVFVLLAVLFFERVSRWVTTHPIIPATVAIALYLIWLFTNVRELWSEEFSDQSPTVGSGCVPPGNGLYRLLVG